MITRKMKALITGITGQDGSYLAELLLEKGYEVHGIIRRSSSFNTGRIDHIFDKLKLFYGDMSDSSICNVILKEKYDEIYLFAAQSHVRTSFDIPEYTANVDAMGTLRIMDFIKIHGIVCKIYFAGSSEMFGKAVEIPQKETTPFYPRSVYGISKMFSFWTIKNYREAYNLFSVNGILFNHESPRRGETFVSRKITKGISKIYNGLQDKIDLGNLEAKRDWGYAKEYIEVIWKMLQQDKPDDFVIATGQTHTVREFVEKAFKHIDIDINWWGEGKEEKGVDKKTGRTLVEINPRLFRPTEVDVLLGDASKAKKILGWEPKVQFDELIQMMMKSDLGL